MVDHGSSNPGPRATTVKKDAEYWGKGERHGQGKGLARVRVMKMLLEEFKPKRNRERE
jgi:hypothetical protein